MKRIITLFFAFATISLSFAQSNEILKTKKSVKYNSTKLEPKLNNMPTQNRMAECMWESDFSNAADWVIAHDSQDCSLDWEITESPNSLDCGGFYQINTIDSEDGYYAMLDSDEYGGEEGGTEMEDSWLTMANPVDCSESQNVIVEIDTWYQSFTTEKCFIVVSTDGTFPTDLTAETEHDPSLGIYEIFPDISGEGQANTGNPHTRSINISPSAGGQAEVWVRFNWTGTWGYAWFLDRVCIAEQPADDIVLNYGAISHNNTYEEYGRVPLSEVGNDMTFAGEVFNFGFMEQANVSLSMDVVNSTGESVLSNTFGEESMYGFDNEGYLDLSTTISGPVAADQSVYFDQELDASSIGIDTYTATFAASSDNDLEGGEYFGDNTKTREFEITENLYSADGIDVHNNDALDVGRIGTGSLTDGSASDGTMLMAYYDISEATNVAGVTIMLDTYLYSEYTAGNGNPYCEEYGCSEADAEIIVAIRDTTQLSMIANDTDGNYDPTADLIAQSDFYLVTQDDVDNGFATIPFPEPQYLSADAYYISVEMYSNGEENNIYILDDETVPQPYYLAHWFLPGDGIYNGDGNAWAIRLITGDSVGMEEENSISGLNIYPNPSNGILNIELDENGEFSVEVTDIVGKIVSNNNINSNTTLNLSELDKGVYFVTVSNNETMKTTKVIIE